MSTSPPSVFKLPAETSVLELIIAEEISDKIQSGGPGKGKWDTAGLQQRLPAVGHYYHGSEVGDDRERQVTPVGLGDKTQHPAQVGLSDQPGQQTDTEAVF